MGASAVSASLWMASNCRQQSVCWRAVLLFRGTWAGGGSGLTGASQSWAKANARSCPWDGITLCKGVDWGPAAWEAVLPKGIWGSSWTAIWVGASSVPLQQRKSPASLGCVDKSVASRSGKDPSPLFGICETDCGAPCPVLGFPEQEGCWLMETKWGDQGAVANGIWYEAERAGSTQP